MKHKNKKRIEPRFELSRRGYDIETVEAFLQAEAEKSATVQMEQKERISALKAQCAAQAAELNALKAREEQIKSTLVSATEKAEKMTLDIKLRYALELDRLKLFRAKWVGAYEEIKERYHFSKDALNMESVAVTTEMEIQKFLAQDFSIDKGDAPSVMEQHFKNEAERLSSPESNARELAAKLTDAAGRKTAERLISARAAESLVAEKSAEKLVIEKAEKQLAIEKADKQLAMAKADRQLCESVAASKQGRLLYDNFGAADTGKQLYDNMAASKQGRQGGDGGAFSMEDAMHPKESLAELCEYLGLKKTSN